MKRFVGYLISKTPRAKKVAPTITQPKQLKKTMKKIKEKYSGISVREKEESRRLMKTSKLKEKRKEGIKAGKELKKMVETGQAEKIGKQIFFKNVPKKRTGSGKKGEFVVDKIERKGKARGGLADAVDKLKEKPKKKKDNIREKILPKKKQDRLEELRKELGMKKGGKAKFPDLTGDGKVTRADILKGRGVFKMGGKIQKDKEMKPLKRGPKPGSYDYYLQNIHKGKMKRKFGGTKGKK